MTQDRITQLAQANPVRSLTTRLGQETEEVNTLVDRLAAALKAHDHTCELLNKLGLPQLPDFGEIGNAAATARRLTVSGAVRPTFQLPRAS